MIKVAVLGVSEAVSNAIIHAFPEPDPAAAIMLVGEVTHAALTVWVEDNGTGMRPRTDSPGAGLGLHIIETLTTSYETCDRPPPGGVRLVMRFSRAG